MALFLLRRDGKKKEKRKKNSYKGLVLIVDLMHIFLFMRKQMVWFYCFNTKYQSLLLDWNLQKKK